VVRIACLSDTHCQHRTLRVPDGDVLLHAGDFTKFGDLDHVADFNAWLGTLPHRHKIVIAGNHELPFEDDRDGLLARSMLTNATYLQDAEARAEGLRIWGSPWQPEFGRMAFNLPRGAPLARKWALIPPGVDVVVTHGPPLGIGDELPGGNHVGCGELARALRRRAPRLHVSGHIHIGHGVRRDGPTIYVNAAICDDRYEAVRQPIVVDLE
jgi:hypothetical protein